MAIFNSYVKLPEGNEKRIECHPQIDGKVHHHQITWG
jgi:hypothetical protein